MKCGLTLPNGGPCGDPLTLTELARIAEEIGWDGAIFYPNTGKNWTPADVHALKSFIKQHRLTSAPFDIVISGQERTGDVEQDRAFMQSLAEAGGDLVDRICSCRRLWYHAHIHRARSPSD